MTESPTEARSGSWWLLVLLLLGPILYVASIGPVAWFVRTSGLPMDSIPGMMLSHIYWPLEFLANQTSWFGYVLIWYVELFHP